MEETFSLRFLGPVQIAHHEEPVCGFRSRKALAVLAYLAAQRQPIPREQLVGLFWGNHPEDRGRANLSWVLNHISTHIPGCLETTRHVVQFRRAPSYWLDIDAFEELEARGKPAALAAAVDLVRGEFLVGLRLDGCPEYEIWLVGEQERWRQRVARALQMLIVHHGQRGAYSPGVRFARQLLALDPWRERAHRQLMRLLALSGQRGAALAQYETCRQVLARELDAAPAAETTRLYEQIRAGELTAVAQEPHNPEAWPAALPPFLTGEGTKESQHPVLVARERELAQLDGFLDQALEGQGRVVFVTGDAGQGKTVLIQEFARRAQAAHADLVVAGGSANAHTGLGDPYLPFREALSLLTGDVEARWSAGAMGSDQARRLWHILPQAAQALVEVGPDLVGLFVPGLPLLKRATAANLKEADWLPRLQELVEGRAAPLPEPSLQQSALFEQYTRVVRTLAQRSPLLLVVDDLQWVDSGSANLLFHLGKRIEGERVLIVGAYRPEEVVLGHPASALLPARNPDLGLLKETEEGWGRHPLEPVVNELQRHYGDIVVGLGPVEDRRFVDALLDTEANRLGDDFRETLYRQTRGHPLFTIELLRGMQERGGLIQDQEGRWVEGATLDWEQLPARVEAVIGERIGRLPQRLQDVLTAASVEGDPFTAEVIARVRAEDEQDVVECLSAELDRRHRLVSAQGVLRADGRRLSLYRFRHILFQKYLYRSLDPVERVHLHEGVGTALEALYEGTGEIGAVAPQLARHFGEAGSTGKTVAYLRQAGERAVEMLAHEEAIAHFRQALALLGAMPDTLERAQQELELQVDLLVPLQATRGPGVPELGQACDRARELYEETSARRLAQGAQETLRGFTVLAQLANFYELRGAHGTAHEMGTQLLDMARRAGDPLLLAWAHMLQGTVTNYLGEFAQARSHLERVIAIYDPQLHHPLARSFGPDIGVYSLSLVSNVLWLLGYPEQGLRRGQEAIALADGLSHPYSQALAHGLAGWLHVFRRDPASAQEHAEASIRLASAHGFPYFTATGHILQGWALAEQGQVERGITEIRQGAADYVATGAAVGEPNHLAMVAEVCGKAGHVEEGLALLTRALEITHRNEERWCEAKLHLLRGELLRMQGAEAAPCVEACFQRAISVARQQQAKSWELRAVISLCRLWQGRGEREKARRCLVDVYHWFTEGFDTPDLQEARSLVGGSVETGQSAEPG